MNIFYGVLLVPVGILSIAAGIALRIKPELGWRRERWKHNGDSRPSNAFLQVSALRGIVFIILGIFILLFCIDLFGTNDNREHNEANSLLYKYGGYATDDDEISDLTLDFMLDRYASDSDIRDCLEIQNSN